MGGPHGPCASWRLRRRCQVSTDLLLFAGLIATGSGLAGFLVGSHLCNEAWHRHISNSVAPSSSGHGMARGPRAGEGSTAARPTYVGFNPFDDEVAA